MTNHAVPICFLATDLMTELPSSVMFQTGAFGLVAWLFFQTFRKTLPETTAAFQLEARAQRELFQRELNQQRETFEKTLKEIENGFVEKINSMFLAEIRQQRVDFRDELSKQRHALLNLTQSKQSNLDLALAKLRDANLVPDSVASESTP